MNKLKIIAFATLLVIANTGLPSTSSANSENMQSTPTEQSTQAQVNEAYGKLPMSFEANQGQTDSEAKYLSRGSGYTLFLTQDEAVLSLSSGSKENVQTGVLHMKPLGANPNAKITGMGELAGKSNYFAGNDPSKWSTNVPNFAKVKYENLYPGIDQIYYGNQQELEYDFVVRPGADPNNIVLKFTGAENISINDAGELVLKTPNGEVRQRKPLAYQESSGVKTEILSRYVLDKNTVRFEIGNHDKNKQLIIYPVLDYSTFLGGSSLDQGNSITVDAAGNVYIAGYTVSIDFPTSTGVYQSSFGGITFGGGDAFITRLSTDGSALVYSTYLGGDRDDYALGIAIDNVGNSYITGATHSANFPTATPIQPNHANPNVGIDVFIVKLDPAGSALTYSTFLGGSNNDAGRAIAVDSNGNVYITGITDCLFPLVNSFDFFCSPSDAFVTKVNAAGSALVYSRTYAFALKHS